MIAFWEGLFLVSCLTAPNSARYNPVMGVGQWGLTWDGLRAIKLCVWTAIQDFIPAWLLPRRSARPIEVHLQRSFNPGSTSISSLIGLWRNLALFQFPRSKLQQERKSQLTNSYRLTPMPFVPNWVPVKDSSADWIWLLLDKGHKCQAAITFSSLPHLITARQMITAHLMEFPWGYNKNQAPGLLQNSPVRSQSCNGSLSAIMSHAVLQSARLPHLLWLPFSYLFLQWMTLYDSSWSWEHIALRSLTFLTSAEVPDAWVSLTFCKPCSFSETATHSSMSADTACYSTSGWSSSLKCRRVFKELTHHVSALAPWSQHNV